MLILDIKQKNDYKYAILYIDLGYKSINIAYQMPIIAEILNEKVSTLAKLEVGKYPIAKLNLGVTK